MLQEMTNVLARQNAKQPAATLRAPGELIVDYGREAIAGDDEVWFFGEIIVHDITSVLLPQQVGGIVKVLHIARLTFVHRHAVNVAAFQYMATDLGKCGNAWCSREYKECPCFAGE